MVILDQKGGSIHPFKSFILSLKCKDDSISSFTRRSGNDTFQTAILDTSVKIEIIRKSAQIGLSIDLRHSKTQRNLYK